MHTENLIPFDLEKAKSGYQIVTRDGTPVTEWKHFETTNSHYSVYANLPSGVGCFQANGKYYNDGEDSSKDLFLLPKETSVYRNVYLDKTTAFGDCETLDKAMYSIRLTEPICIIKITTTETGKTTAEIVHHY